MNKELIFFIALVMALILPSCARIESDNDRSDTFPIEEARTLFEKELSNRATRSGATVKNRSRLSPGDFSPMWESAEYAEKSGTITYLIPLNSEYRLYSHGGKYGEKTKRPWRRVSQELLISKNLSSGKVDISVKSTIKRHGLKQTDKFSGLEVLNDFVTGSFKVVRLYEKGALKEEVVIDKSKGRPGLVEDCKKAVALLKGYQFFRNRNIMTRSDDGEGDPEGDDGGDEWDYPDPDDLEDWGDGLYYDPDSGALYYDSDGDGVIDSMLLDPSYCEGGDEGGGDDPDDPDPDDPIDPDDPGYDPDDPNNPPEPDGPTNAELEAIGLAGVNKMAADVNNGNVTFYKNVGYALTGISFPANANSILYSSAATLEAARSNQLLLRGIGASLSGVATAIGAYQTIVAFSDSNPGLTTGELLNCISTSLGVISLVTLEIPAVSLPVGIASGIIGMISVFFSESIESGEYILKTSDGREISIYIYIS